MASDGLMWSVCFAVEVQGLMLCGCSLRILVNRGWVPRNKMNPGTRREAQVVVVNTVTVISTPKRYRYVKQKCE